MNDDLALATLMRAYQQGSLEAFERLHAALAPELLRAAAREADPERAPDLVQEAFLQLHRARHTWDPERPLRPWVYAILRHVALAARRRHARRFAREVPLDGGREPVAPATVPASPLVRGALHRLGAERGLPLVLHHAFGWSFRDIAQRLGIAEGAARVRAARARAELRRQLGEQRR